MSRVVPLTAILVLTMGAPARANPNDQPARELLAKLAAAGSAKEIEASATELAELSPMPVAVLAESLGRQRSSTPEARRAVLKAIGADVPNEAGKFETPRRQTAQEQQKNDEFDWLAALARSGDAPGRADAIVDVAAIRALAASRDPAGGDAILRFAFEEAGVSYRDECGRYLRKMSPWSLPALIRGSEARDASLARYATYQLERLDREDPNKAVRYAGSEELTIAILKAFSDAQYREAVYPVLKMLDDVNPRIREAARATWQEFVSGKEPRPSPRKKIQMPGGKLSDKPVPLWFNHRELADIEIRRVLEQLTGKPPAQTATLAEMTKELFAYYDDQRDKQLGTRIDAALAKAKSGELEQAAGQLDQILAQRPDHPRRGEMAQVYFELAEALERKAAWADASIAYAKAEAMDPDGPNAKPALAKHHYTRGKALEADGHDASAEFARARDVEIANGAGQQRWMLYAGAGGGLAGLLLLVIGLVLRRR